MKLLLTRNQWIVVGIVAAVAFLLYMIGESRPVRSRNAQSLVQKDGAVATLVRSGDTSGSSWKIVEGSGAAVKVKAIPKVVNAISIPKVSKPAVRPVTTAFKTPAVRTFQTAKISK